VSIAPAYDYRFQQLGGPRPGDSLSLLERGVAVRIPVSVFIIAFNEADRIGRAIGSVLGWVDEIIVVDAYSTDDTAEICRAAGAKVIVRKFDGFGQQKRFGESHCRNKWVLNLDADEEVTAELRADIVALFDRGVPSHSAYGMPVKLVYPGHSEPRPLARDHWCVRLYDRTVVRFRDDAVHDSVVTHGIEVRAFRSHLRHYSIRSFRDMRRKLNGRSMLRGSSKQRWTATLWVRLVTELPATFLKYYVGRCHWTGGITGLQYAAIIAWFRQVRIYRILFGSQSAGFESWALESVTDSGGHRGGLDHDKQRSIAALSSAIRAGDHAVGAYVARSQAGLVVAECPIHQVQLR
jgi:glycosyltransferase involved in cell wall biosynthesis